MFHFKNAGERPGFLVDAKPYAGNVDFNRAAARRSTAAKKSGAAVAMNSNLAWLVRAASMKAH